MDTAQVARRYAPLRQPSADPTGAPAGLGACAARSGADRGGCRWCGCVGDRSLRGYVHAGDIVHYCERRSNTLLSGDSRHHIRVRVVPFPEPTITDILALVCSAWQGARGGLLPQFSAGRRFGSYELAND